jgi:hypothetical protein
MTDQRPQIDLICNLVARREDGRVLFVREDPQDPRWGLPYRGLVPYQHPDEVAPSVLADWELTSTRLLFSEIESFRGRSGWHVMFNYLADVSGEARQGTPSDWFAPEAMPHTLHGRWEKDVVLRALTRAG